MKKSTLFLSLALTLPAFLTFAGIAATVRSFDFTSASTNPLPPPGDTTLPGPDALREVTVPVEAALRVEASGVRLRLSFDPALTGRARVRVEKRDFNGVASILTPDRLKFTGHAPSTTPAADAPYVALTLPASFETLALSIEASRCELETDHARVDVATLRVETRASSCAFAFHRLVAKEVSLRVEAGTATFSVADLPAYAISARLRVGSLDLRYGASREHLTGLNHERRIDGPPGATPFDFEVSTGKLDVDLAAPREGITL